MFSVLLEGSFMLQGFRNKDIRERLFPRGARNADERRKVSGRVTRWLRLLRAHGLVRIVSGTFYYRFHEFVLQRWGATDAELLEWLGHQHSEMMRLYRHLRPEDSQRKDGTNQLPR